MEKDLLENITIPEGEIYTSGTIVVSSFFGGLLASSFMIYRNFKTFGEHKKAGATILLTILTLVGIVATAFIPALDKIPGIIYTLFITLATSALTKKYQGTLIEKHKAAGGKIYSTGRAVLICVISILLIVGFLLGAFFLQDAAITNAE